MYLMKPKSKRIFILLFKTWNIVRRPWEQTLLFGDNSLGYFALSSDIVIAETLIETRLTAAVAKYNQNGSQILLVIQILVIK